MDRAKVHVSLIPEYKLALPVEPVPGESDASRTLGGRFVAPAQVGSMAMIFDALALFAF
jgi:hypothetical protein